MKRCLLFLAVLFCSIIIAQALEDKIELPKDKTLIPESTQLKESIPITTTLTDSVPKGWTLGYKQGRLDGSKRSQIGWFASGCAGGTLGSCIGGGIVFLIAEAVTNKPRLIPHVDTAYQTGYLKGYKESSKDKRILAAIGGGVLGSICFFTALIIFGAIWETGMPY